MKVYQLSANWTDVSKMKDGDIAVIRQWPGVEDYAGFRVINEETFYLEPEQIVFLAGWLNAR
jgi:hypothetical protein